MIAQLNKQIDTARRALGIANQFKCAAYSRKHKSRIFKNLNRLRNKRRRLEQLKAQHPAILTPAGQLLNIEHQAIDTAATRSARIIANDIYKLANSAGICALTIAQIINHEISSDQASYARR